MDRSFRLAKHSERTSIVLGLNLRSAIGESPQVLSLPKRVSRRVMDLRPLYWSVSCSCYKGKDNTYLCATASIIVRKT